MLHRSKPMMKKFYIASILMFAVAFFSCEKEVIQPNMKADTHTCGEEFVDEGVTNTRGMNNGDGSTDGSKEGSITDPDEDEDYDVDNEGITDPDEDEDYDADNDDNDTGK